MSIHWILHKKYRLGLRLRGILVRCYIVCLGGTCGKDLLVDRGFFMKHAPHRGLNIGDRVTFGRNTTIDVPVGGHLEIHNDVGFTMNVLLAAAGRMTIGEKTLVAEFTSIRDANHGIESGMPIRDQDLVAAPVTVGKNVWIGRGVAVLKGASIGDGAVIGANAVVAGEIPAGSIAVGIPAKVVKYRHGL